MVQQTRPQLVRGGGELKVLLLRVVVVVGTSVGDGGTCIIKSSGWCFNNSEKKVLLNLLVYIFHPTLQMQWDRPDCGEFAEGAPSPRLVLRRYFAK